MIKDLSLKLKFEFLGPIFAKVLHDIRRDVKQEHLKKDRDFVQRYFGKAHLDKVSAEEIFRAYSTEIIQEGNEDLAGWVVSKWILKHAEMYEYFVSELSRVNPRFEEIQLLGMDVSKSMAAQAVDRFSLVDTYIFSVINSVAFPDEIFDHLKKQAQSWHEEQLNKSSSLEQVSIEALVRRHNEEMLKLSDRYEKRLQAVSKKYMQDIDGLKKQLAILQKRLSEKVYC